MGIRGEIFSTKLILQNRTYFFNVKENRMGDLYLNIVESKNKDTGGFERQSVIVFADDLSGFLGNFDEALKVLEKAVREQKRKPQKPSGWKEKAPLRETGASGGEPRSSNRPSDRSRRAAREPEDGKASGARKVIVRKNKSDT